MDIVSVRQANQSRKIAKRVFFAAGTALAKGIGLCYDRIVASALSADIPATVATAYAEVRDNVVALPATANRGNFAGVTSQSYAASTGGYWLTIYEPGSVCEVACDIATVINVTQITCQVNADPGVFGLAGNAGRGSAVAMQTNLTASATSGPGPNVASIDGSATFTLATRNVAKTGLFANAIAGDFLVVYGGAVAADGTAPLTPGVYTIGTVTDANNAIMIAGTTMGTAAAVTTLNGQVVRGNPTVLARLLDGPESGCTDYLTTLSGSSGTLDINGFTYFPMGGITLAADATPGLAVNTIVGRRRGFKILGGVITTSEILVTPTTTTALKPDQVTTLASAEIGETGQIGFVLEWFGTKWVSVYNQGAVYA